MEWGRMQLSNSARLSQIRGSRSRRRKRKSSMKKQVLFIQGAGEGAYEEDQKLVESLQHVLGPEYTVHYPAMPDEDNAPYEQWKRQIEKELAEMRGPIILVGHSVGASVVVKC